MRFALGFFVMCLLIACGKESPRFTTLSLAETGIDFRNDLEYSEAFNVYTYKNFYNGAGVGIGDVNADGLPDLYFCGNMVDNRLYLNRGNWQFEDVTATAGVACPDVWSSGVAMADVNNDGHLDLYVCKAGSPGGNNRHNELFLNDGNAEENNGVPTFTEAAERWGIANEGLSTHAAFFDYDQDGDLDMYLLNNSLRPVGGYDIREGLREQTDSLGGNRLYRHDGDHYTDVSTEAGIYGSAIGFGLGVTIGDVDRDGWQDIFVSNDFFERDYLYLNNRDGTFREDLPARMPEISMGSMGADMADLNNDGYPEVFVTDMLPEDNARMKTKTAFETWDTYQRKVKNGYHHQFTRNVLHLNRGDGRFSEVSRYAGVEATDWSWGALLFDMDNDGYRDIFVANGIYKDLTDQDYINFYSDPATKRKLFEEKGTMLTTMIDAMPSVPLPNYAFRNVDGVRFENQAQAWGLAEAGFSNGSAYGDLDNDGDLDLVVNNVQAAPFIYRNQTREREADVHFIGFDLRRADTGAAAYGAQVTIHTSERQQYLELAPMRGFQSQVDARLLFGLGNVNRVDSVVIRWPGNIEQAIATPEIDRYHTVVAPAIGVVRADDDRPSSSVTGRELAEFRQPENTFSDFDRNRLLYHMQSTEGPRAAVADVNGDDRNDIYIGGAKGVPGRLLLGAETTFTPKFVAAFEADKGAEDMGIVFFDADQDGDQDLLVSSGGSEFSGVSSALKDRLYLNDGSGNFARSPQNFGRMSTSCVRAYDFDADGDLDLFAGERLRPFGYGEPVSGHLYRNDGTGNFTDVTAEVAPALRDLGMLTDAQWLDYDQDGDSDLLVVGEWMPITLLENRAGQFIPVESTLSDYKGLFNTLEVADLNRDGLPDFVVGNLGLNTRLTATPEHPLSLYVHDFDQNGSADHLLTAYEGDRAYPLALRHDLVSQLPSLKKKYLKYESYRDQTIENIFGPEAVAAAKRYDVTTTASYVGINRGDGEFELVALPYEAQLAPIFAIAILDTGHPNGLSMLVGGNLRAARPEIGGYAGSYTSFLHPTNEAGHYRTAPDGPVITGEVRDLVQLNENDLFVIRNNAAPVYLENFIQ